MLIGLTGGIGCGKSTVLALFAGFGWHTLDADAIVRDLLENDSEVGDAISSRWGNEVLTHGGKIDRAAVAEIVFKQTLELQWLEELLHPRVREVWSSKVETSPDRDWVVEIPLLFEKNLENHFDITVCIACSESAQRHRLAAKGVSPEQFQARLLRQMPIHEKMRLAHRVITNDGTLEFLRQQVERFCSTIQRPDTATISQP